jgi:4-cresol dehydrogenase (hydroxylating)
VLPPRVSARNFEKALRALAGVVGDSWVLSSEDDLRPYRDNYAPGDVASHVPSAVVAPASVDEIRGALKVANQYRVPLWPLSRGKNLGYGGSAPRMSGTVLLDLSRMNRILEVNERAAYCVVEPGVSFFDLFNALQGNKIPLWISAPGNGWGSVVGNALERGIGQSPYGDHASKVCGMEVVLADGSIVRTGMGAMGNSAMWPLFRYGFGPSWDQVFMQSNYGIVTRMGLWLMPEPEASIVMTMDLPEEGDLEWIIDVLHPLRLAGVTQNNPSVGNVIRLAATLSQREQWFKEKRPMPDDVIREIAKALKLGWWHFDVRLFGHDEINEVNARLVRDAFAAHTSVEFKVRKWKRGEPIMQSGTSLPGTFALQIVNWRGGQGGHMDFSPVSPPTGAHAMKQYRMARKRYEEFGFDYSGGFTLGERHLNHISMVLFDRNDEEMTRKARELYRLLVKEAAAEGYGEYRTHLSFMDDVAATYNFGGNSLLKLNEAVKDALDPNGILAPGKQGIWPRTLRKDAR